MSLLRLTLVLAVLTPVAFAQVGGVAASSDRDLSFFGSVGRTEAKAPETGAAKARTEPKVSSRADILALPGAGILPARTFPAGNGFSKIQSRGRGLDFTFNDARFADAITEISNTFDVVISYAGDPDRRVIGRYGNIRSPGQLLALLTDMTDLVVVVTQRGFIIQQLDSSRIPTLNLDDVIEVGGH